jgi:hypothetical protein
MSTTETAKRRRGSVHLDHDGAQRAIYLDFEGTAVDSPSLLGVLVEDEFTQYVFEPDLEPAARAKAVDLGGTCRFTTPEEAFRDLRRRIGQERRRVFAWSTREQVAIGELVSDPDDRTFWTATVENGIPVAAAWKRRHHRHVTFPKGPRGRSGRNVLSRYLDLIGYPVPSVHGPGNTAARIRFVRGALAKRGSYEALTPVQKAKWTNLLLHNRHDCAGLRALMEAVALDRPTAAVGR